jgi:phosphotransferase system enzyme I (PtsI)
VERLTGIGVSPGIAVGRAVVLTQPTEVVRFPVAAERVDREVASIDDARELSRQQLLDIRARLASGPVRDMAPLFDAQLLMLDDPLLVAILARSLQVPAVVGLHDLSGRIAAGVALILDGTTGEVRIGPDAAELEAAERASARRARPAATARGTRGPLTTADGVPIRLDANLELLGDLQFLHESGADGIGLYRSEFLLSERALDAATEDVQYEAYCQVLKEMAPHRVTIRTFDLDERHVGPGRLTDRSRARRGLRGLRLGLVCDNLSVPRIPVGAMIEVPAAAVATDLLAREADFLTIGTNDLIQYTLAVDRTDDRVSEFYEPLHPAVLRLVRLISRAARREGVPVSLCGEMASDPALVALLIGLGLTDFSMTPGAIPIVRHVVLSLATSEEVEQFLFDALAASVTDSEPR